MSPLDATGTGRHGAYQAGVLQGLAEIVGERFGDRPPFDVVTGISAGAINAAYLASRADRMAEASAGLAALWGELRIDRVMRTDAVSLFSIGTRWLRDLTLGGLLKPDARSNHLLDTTPLREFLIANIDFEAIARHIASDILHGFAVSATSYTTGTAVTFFDGTRRARALDPERSARLAGEDRPRSRPGLGLHSHSVPTGLRRGGALRRRRRRHGDATQPGDPSRSRQSRRHLRAPFARPGLKRTRELRGPRPRRHLDRRYRRRDAQCGVHGCARQRCRAPDPHQSHPHAHRRTATCRAPSLAPLA